MKKATNLTSLIIVVGLMVSLFAGCTKSVTEENTASSTTTPANTLQVNTKAPKELLMEYTFLDTVHVTAPFGYNNPNDIVTPYVETKFNIKVKDAMFSAGQKPLEKINMLVAADNLPDVVLVDNPNLPLIYATGAFADLSQYKDLMVNTDKYVSDTGWNMLKVDGKLVALPEGPDLDLKNPEVVKITDNDPFYRPNSNWGFMVRQSILKQLGYKFKSVQDVQGELDANPRRLSQDDLKLDPPITTYEDFDKLLYNIKKLNLKVNGKPVIPFSIPNWGVYHISSLFAPTGGYYADPDTLQVSGFPGNPNMKDLYKSLRKWFQDGVLDNDYLIQKPEQLQEKIASGRVAVLFMAPDFNAARANLKKLNPEDDLRPIPWPKSEYEVQTGRASVVDPSFPSGYYNIMINKKVKDIPRLLKYFDWFQTEEAMDLTTWGPESAGLYDVKNGKKVFKDNALWEAIRDNKKTADGKNAEFYGIYDKNNPVSIYTSKAFLAAPGPAYNYKGYERSYPAKFDAWNDMWNFVTNKMLNRDGTILSAVGEKSNAMSTYYWSTFSTTKTAQLLSTKTEDDFNKTWDSSLKEFKEKSGYDAAMAEMLPAFKRTLGK